jgi:hypothetical protein
MEGEENQSVSNVKFLPPAICVIVFEIPVYLIIWDHLHGRPDQTDRPVFQINSGFLLKGVKFAVVEAYT